MVNPCFMVHMDEKGQGLVVRCGWAMIIAEYKNKGLNKYYTLEIGRMTTCSAEDN